MCPSRMRVGREPATNSAKSSGSALVIHPPARSRNRNAASDLSVASSLQSGVSGRKWPAPHQWRELQVSGAIVEAGSREVVVSFGDRLREASRLARLITTALALCAGFAVVPVAANACRPVQAGAAAVGLPAGTGLGAGFGAVPDAGASVRTAV